MLKPADSRELLALQDPQGRKDLPEPMVWEQPVRKAHKVLLVQMVLTEQQAHRDRQERKALQEMMEPQVLPDHKDLQD